MNTLMFTDAQFMTAKQKNQVIKAWNTFLKHGLQEKHFTKSIYNHLILHCEFIAHYNQGGFYTEYFIHPEDTLKFLNQFRGNESVEYGSKQWLTNPDYADINSAMVEVTKPYLHDLIGKLTTAIRERDLAMAAGLRAKHGLT